MDPDDPQDFDAYLQASLAARNQSRQPTYGELLAQTLSSLGPKQIGAPGTSTGRASSTPASPGTAQPLGGFYALGAAAMSGDEVGNPAGLYDDNAPDPSAAAANPNFLLAAYRDNTPPPIGLTPTDQGAGPPPPPNGVFGQPAQMWRPPAPNLPSPQDQDAAKAMLLGQGRTPDASYNDPTLDALANTAQGHAVGPGESQPDLSAGRIWADSPGVPHRKVLVEQDIALAQDPRVRAYLDTIAYTEGYLNGRPTEYNSREGDGFAGRRLLFDGYDHYPQTGGIIFNGAPQSAAGRYQITKDTYGEYRDRLGLVGYSPQVQDVMAVQMLRDNGAIGRLMSGDVAGAVDASSGRWVSMPRYVGGQWRPRYDGQKAVPIDAIQSYYQDRLRLHASQR